MKVMHKIGPKNEPCEVAPPPPPPKKKKEWGGGGGGLQNLEIKQG